MVRGAWCVVVVAVEFDVVVVVVAVVVMVVMVVVGRVRDSNIVLSFHSLRQHEVAAKI